MGTSSITHKRNEAIGWVVWRLAKRRARRAMPSALRRNARPVLVGGSAMLAALGAIGARRGVNRLRNGRAARA